MFFAEPRPSEKSWKYAKHSIPPGDRRAVNLAIKATDDICTVQNVPKYLMGAPEWRAENIASQPHLKTASYSQVPQYLTPAPSLAA